MAHLMENVVLFLLIILGKADGRIITLIQTTKPNAGQPVALICEADGSPSSAPGPDALTLTGPGETVVVASDTSVTNDTRKTTFMVTVHEPNAEFVCSLLDTDGSTILDQRRLEVDIFVLPYLLSPPTVRLADYSMPTALTVSWLPWETDGAGDGPVLGYQVVYGYESSEMDGDAAYNDSLVLDSNSTTSAVITDLDVDQEYDFAVVVVREGEGGAGPPSNKTTAKTGCTAPSMAATITELTALSPTVLQVTWENPPSSTWGCRQLNDMAYLQYRISDDPNSFYTLLYIDASPLPYNLTSLYPCTTYDVKVLILNSGFWPGPVSESKNATTEQIALQAVGFVTTWRVPNALQLQVRWTQPDAFSRRCVDQFYVTYTLLRQEACEDDAASPVTLTEVVSGDVTSTILNNLTAYATYNVTVSASNEVGNSSLEFDTGTTAQALASVLTTLQVADIAERFARLEWDRIPCGDLRGSFYQYRVVFTNNNTGESFTRSVASIDSTSQEEAYLLPCTAYDVQIAVENGQGIGPYSENVQFTTSPEVPYVIRNHAVIAVVDNPNQLLVTWEAPAYVYCPIDYYRITYKLVYKYQCEIVSDGERVLAANATGTSHTVTGLLPYSTYWVYVTAHNEAGFGTVTAAGYQTHVTAERAPTVSPVSVMLYSSGERRLSFTWAGPDCTDADSTSRILGYAYQLVDLTNNSTPPTVGEGSGYLASYEDLSPYTRYAFQVRFRSGVGDGPYSDPVEGMTFEEVPGPPASLRVTGTNETTIMVIWEATLNPNGVIIDYIVQYKAVEKPYDLGFVPQQLFSELSPLGPQVFTNTLMYLEPSTKYEIRVLALTSPGLGEPVTARVFTKPKTDFQGPLRPDVDPSRSSGTSIFIYISGGDPTYVSSYLVAVKKVPARAKRAAVEIGGEAFGTHSENPDAYIAADIPKRDNDGGFVVGDGKMYGDYLNAPLQKGTYSIRTGAVSQTDEASVVVWSEPVVATASGSGVGPMPTQGPTPDKTNPPAEGDVTVGIIAGVLVALVLAISIGGLLIFYLKKKRNRQTDPTVDTPLETRGNSDGNKN